MNRKVKTSSNCHYFTITPDAPAGSCMATIPYWLTFGDQDSSTTLNPDALKIYLNPVNSSFASQRVLAAFKMTAFNLPNDNATCSSTQI